MFPATPPVTDISRTRLKKLASWIRDDLDPIIAREGPRVLRPDDVLQLHEVFQALRVSQSITALDLRATHIHRALMEVAGTATRWPGRLADDCDRVMAVWSSKFGRLDNLHPFLFGRGGRLEGIAGPDEFSKASLLKRWQSNCPENVVAKRTHRHGHLGFRPGSWWLNPMFAYHAGIIDLDCAEGGICYDSNEAYAVLLREASEVESCSGDQFTYRCGQRDKGRFRLTSATWRSRFPIRILRSHHVNSIWGPKAGVRYEGLYRIEGWVIRAAVEQDATSEGHSVGDLIFDIKFERLDPVPMDEIMKHPTAAELDDYTEYKRLRRLYREGKKCPVSQLKPVPPVQPVMDVVQKTRSTAYGQHGTQRNATFKDPISTVLVLPAQSQTSSRQAPTPTAKVATIDATVPRILDDGLRNEVSHRPTKTLSPNGSKGIFTFFSSSESSREKIPDRETNIREVAPWVDHEPDLKMPLPGIKLPHANLNWMPRSPTGMKSHSRALSRSYSPFDTSHDPLTLRGKDLQKRKINNTKRVRASNTHNEHTASKKSGKKHSPRGGEMLDGSEDSSTDFSDGYFSYEPVFRHASFNIGPAMPMVQHRQRASSSSLTMRPISPASPNQTFPTQFGRSDFTSYPYGFGSFSGTGSLYSSDDAPRPDPSPAYSDPFREYKKPPSRQSRPSLPMSLKSFLLTPSVVPPINGSSAVSVSGAISPLDRGTGGGPTSLQKRLILQPSDSDHEDEVKRDKDGIIFKNPFKYC